MMASYSSRQGAAIRAVTGETSTELNELVSLAGTGYGIGLSDLAAPVGAAVLTQSCLPRPASQSHRRIHSLKTDSRQPQRPDGVCIVAWLWPRDALFRVPSSFLVEAGTGWLSRSRSGMNSVVPCSQNSTVYSRSSLFGSPHYDCVAATSGLALYRVLSKLMARDERRNKYVFIPCSRPKLSMLSPSVFPHDLDLLKDIPQAKKVPVHQLK